MNRSKSLPIRSSRKRLDPYPSPASFPEEPNQRVGSGVRYALQIESGDDADVEIVSDTFDGSDVPRTKRHCPGTSETDRGGESQPLDLKACILCEIADESVSRCSGSDCIICFHSECLNARFGSGGDDLADMYCPYCWFKIVALRTTGLKEKGVEVEMAVFKHRNKEMASRGEGNERVSKGREDENGNREDSVDTTDIVSDQEVEGEKGAYSSQKKQVQVDEKDCDESRGENTPLIEETYQREEDEEDFEVHTDKLKDMEEDKVVYEVEESNDEERAATENFQDAEDELTAVDQSKANTGAGRERDASLFLSMKETFSGKANKGAGKKRDASLFLSMKETFSGKEHDQIQQNEKRRRKRRLILNAFDSDVSSNGSTNEPNGEDRAEEMNSLALVVTSPLGKTKNLQRDTTTEVDNSETVRDIPIFNQKRRLLWTPEEENMLKVGVEKFAAEAKRNIPWRKILEMGRKVFHETRAPADLKDKWRNMTGARLGKKNKQDSTQVSAM